MSEGPPPEARLWDALRGAMVTKTLGLVADLGVADALAGGARPVDALARELGVSEDVLYRFLRALASDGIFTEDSPRVFANTSLSERLQREHTQRWREFAHFFGDSWFRAFADAGKALETGQASFPATFGAGFWAWLEAHPEEGKAFNRAMAGEAGDRAERLAALDWREGETVVDVGGGNGAVLIDLLRTKPGLRGIVYDLPETAAEAEEQVARAGLADRCAVVAGSFFEFVPSGDVYLLSRILHDWDNADASKILHTIRAAAPSARLVIRDSVIPAGDEPHGAKWLDLLMLVLAGGRERSADEWRTLLEGAGFEPTSIDDGLIEARCIPM